MKVYVDSRSQENMVEHDTENDGKGGAEEKANLRRDWCLNDGGFIHLSLNHSLFSC